MKKGTINFLIDSTTVNNNSPIQDYVHPDDQTQPFEMTPGFKPFTDSTLLQTNNDFFLSDIHLCLWVKTPTWDFRCVITGVKLTGNLAPVVQRRISTGKGLNFNLGFFFVCSKAFSQIIFSILCCASNQQIVGKTNKTECAF